jgi:hypothetical protein
MVVMKQHLIRGYSRNDDLPDLTYRKVEVLGVAFTQ